MSQQPRPGLSGERADTGSDRRGGRDRRAAYPVQWRHLSPAEPRVHHPIDITLVGFDRARVCDRGDDVLVAFVDHAVPGATHRAPEGTPIDTVIDDLPSEAIEARFLNHRATIGATAIILTEYIGAFDLALDVTLATALLFALRRETLGFRVG